MADIDKARLEQLGEDLTADTLICDVSNEEDIAKLAEKVQERPHPIGLVFANAGVMKNLPALETTAEDWAFTFGINLMGVVHMANAFIPLLKTQKGVSRFIATASIAGFLNAPGSAAYNASKQAVIGYMETLFQELKDEAPHIGLSVLSPGAVKTDILNIEKYGRIGATGQAPQGMKKLMAERGFEAGDVASFTFEAIADDVFYIFPHDYVFDRLKARIDAIMRGQNPKWMTKTKEKG